MLISSRAVPTGSKITAFQEPVLGQPGLEALSPVIASAIGRWSFLEKQLDQVHTLVTDGDAEERKSFDQLKGWDRRFQAIAEAGARNLDITASDYVRAVLRVIEAPAGKRNELAHRVWAVTEGFEDHLTLLSQSNQHLVGEAAVAAKKAGTGLVPLNTDDMYKDSRLVSVDDLVLLVRELEAAQNRLNALIRGYLYEPFLDESGNSFENYRAELAADNEVAERIKNMARNR